MKKILITLTCIVLCLNIFGCKKADDNEIAQSNDNTAEQTENTPKDVTEKVESAPIETEQTTENEPNKNTDQEPIITDGDEETPVRNEIIYTETPFGDTEFPPVPDGMEAKYIGGVNSVTASNYEQLYKLADYVVVATAVNDYADDKQMWKNGNDIVVDSYEQAESLYSTTRRTFSVEKVYKGENTDVKEIILAEQAFSNGKEIKIMEGEYVAQKGHKYLLFLNRTNETDAETFNTLFGQGKYDLDADNSKNNQIQQWLFEEVKENYKELF